MNYVMRWLARSDVELLAGVAAAPFFAAPAGSAGVPREPVLSIARRLVGLTRVMSTGSEAELDQVFCTSPGNCWTVGEYFPAVPQLLSQMLRWNGSKWRPFPVPEPGGTAVGDYNALFSVRCLTARDCWAVGSFANGNEGNRYQVLHWDGTKWSHVGAPNPGGTTTCGFNALDGVRCTSAANCWAVGEQANGSNFVDEILHWNGRKWAPVGIATGGAG